MQGVSVAVVGATGLVGQHLVRLLADHPWFDVAELVASERSAGRSYGEAVEWALPGEAPGAAADLPVLGAETLAAGDVELRAPLVLSALPSGPAREMEPLLAGRGHVVCSNASAFRADPRVPLVVPEVNADHVDLVQKQSWRDAGGALITNPNCMVCGLSLALAPLHRAFGIRSVVAVTMQALSGAGREGLSALATAGNIIPWIEGEAPKVASEPCKILDAGFPMSVMVNRAPVLDGHVASVFVTPERAVEPEQVRAALTEFRPSTEVAALPSAPASPLRLLEEPGRPQPRLDVDAEGGMAVSVGNLGLDSGGAIQLTVLVHNLIRGAAGACLLNAELACSRGLVRDTAGGRRTAASA